MVHSFIALIFDLFYLIVFFFIGFYIFLHIKKYSCIEIIIFKLRRSIFIEKLVNRLFSNLIIRSLLYQFTIVHEVFAILFLVSTFTIA